MRGHAQGHAKCASGLCTPSRDRYAGPIIAPMTPVISTNTAANAATPPICSATSMAIGEVTDLSCHGHQHHVFGTKPPAQQHTGQWPIRHLSPA